MEIQEGTQTITLTTPEPETPQADPVPVPGLDDTARESVLDTSLDAAPVILPGQPEGPHPADMVLSPEETESVYQAYQDLGLIEMPDPLDALRADMMEEINVLADSLSTLTCHLINAQISAYRERRRALLAARKARHEVFQLRAAVAAASKVTVSTSLNLAALDKPVAVDAAPEPPELLGQVTSQVAEMVMRSERMQAADLTPRWDDKLTLARVRLAWPRLDVDQKDEIAVRLLDDVCKEPHQRGTAWRMLETRSYIGPTPAEASAGGAQ